MNRLKNTLNLVLPQLTKYDRLILIINEVFFQVNLGTFNHNMKCKIVNISTQKMRKKILILKLPLTQQSFITFSILSPSHILASLC